jgi:PAS domain S-box-containing protein
MQDIYKKIKSIFQMPFDPSDEKTNQVNIINALLNMGILIMVAYIILVFVIRGDFSSSIIIGMLMALFWVGLRVSVKRGHENTIAVVLHSLSWIVVVYIFAFYENGLRAPAYSAALALLIVNAGVLLGTRAALLTLGISLLASTLIAIGETQGYYLTTPKIPDVRWALLGQIIFFSALTFTIIKTVRNLSKSIVLYRNESEERKKAEEEIRNSEERLKILFESAPDAYYLMDIEGTFLDGNKKAEKLIGYKRKELIGNNFFKANLLSKKELPKATASLSQSIKGKPAGPEEYVLRRKNGRKIPVEISTFPVKIKNQAIILGIARDITERKKTEALLQRNFQQLRDNFIATVNTLASTIEMKDLYTADHQRRVTLLACAIAEELNLSEEQFDGLRMAGLIHDLGKINVPAEILSKTGPISDIERGMIQAHPQACHDLLKHIDLPWPVAQIVLQHHERMDGSGYPHGLKGDEIMLEARILAVADVVEAMASHRPYRPAHSIGSALEEILHNKNILYDPKVVDACLKLFYDKDFKFE